MWSSGVAKMGPRGHGLPLMNDMYIKRKLIINYKFILAENNCKNNIFSKTPENSH